MFCSNCGTQLPDTASFCSKCGNAVRTGAVVQPVQPYPQQPVINVVNSNTVNVRGGYVNKSKWTAFFLCLLLGWLGAHRFYVGKTATAVIWLLTAGLCGFGILIDLILILCNGFNDKMGQPLV